MIDPEQRTVPAPFGVPIVTGPAENTQAESGPQTHVIAGDVPVVPGYLVSHEIGRGGMGTVYAATDLTFERDVAIKVMHPGQDGDRFGVESKITAQLPHPGVPPVYALGTAADGRPFLAMKRVAGRTLADELKATDRTTDRPRLLAAFERICETVGYAHSKGIIHRDLKPQNVMVGGFGEVLVMDWGLARGVRDEGVVGTSPLAPRPSPLQETVAGSVKGTPAYMAPEQARGEAVDCRADVFALGGILAAILTGKPPFTGDTTPELVQRAARADLGECYARLDGCGADVSLVAIAQSCLSAAPAHRFADGQELAATVALYRAGVEERLQRAERDRAVSAAEAYEQRKRRKVQVALACALAVLITAVGAFAWWQSEQRAERNLIAAEQRATELRLEAEQRFNTERARQGIDSGLKLAADLRGQLKFEPAERALRQALELARGGAPERTAEVERARADLTLAVALDGIRYRKWAWVPQEGGKGKFDLASAPGEYRRALAAHGFDPTDAAPTDVAERVKQSDIKAELVAALDDWALYEPDADRRKRLLETVRRADPGPWTDRLRDPDVRADKAAVARLAAERPADAAPTVLVVLTEVMRLRGVDPGAVLGEARSRHPTNFDLAFALGRRFRSFGPDAASYEVARALRPEVSAAWLNLAAALSVRKDFVGALAVLERATELAPNDPQVRSNLGIALINMGRFPDAVAALQKAIELDPKFSAAHSNLGMALMKDGKFDAARAPLERAVALNPNSPIAHSNLGMWLFESGRYDDAIKEQRRAIDLESTFANAHINLGAALAGKEDFRAAVPVLRRANELEPTPTGYTNLGIALWNLDRDDEAVAAYKEAIRLDPKFAPAHSSLGLLLMNARKYDAAIAACREALKYNPNDAPAYATIGTAYIGKNQIDDAIAAYKESLKRNPNYLRVLNNLASACFQKSQFEEAAGYARRTIALNPKDADAHATLGRSLLWLGDVYGARAALTEAVRLDPQYRPLLLLLPPPLPVAPPPREVKRP